MPCPKEDIARAGAQPPTTGNRIETARNFRLRPAGSAAKRVAGGGVGNGVEVLFEGQDEGNLGVAQGVIAAVGGSPVGGNAKTEADGEPDRRAVLGADPGVQLLDTFGSREGDGSLDEPPGNTGGASRRVDPQTEQLPSLPRPRFLLELSDRHNTAGTSVEFGDDPSSSGEL